MLSPLRIGLGFISIAALAACHNAPSSQTAANVAEPSHAVGDSSAFGTTLKWTGVDRHVAAVSLTAPAHVVMLEVWPDGQIAAIHSNVVADGRAKLQPGSHSVGVGNGSFERSNGPNNVSALAGAPASDLRAGYNCAQRQEYSRNKYVTQNAPPAGSVDKFGAPVDAQRAAADLRLSLEMVAPQGNVVNCEKANMLRVDAPTPAKAVAGPATLIPTAPPVADRSSSSYLVALASDVQISAKELNALAIAEGDIQSIVLSLGKKLYGSSRWSASYIRW